VTRQVGDRPERPAAKVDIEEPRDRAATLVLLTWLLPGLGQIHYGRWWQGGLLAVAYLAWAVLVFSRTIPLYVWLGPALLAEVAAQVSIARQARIDWGDLLDSRDNR
jgi:hypothetical protein